MPRGRRVGGLQRPPEKHDEARQPPWRKPPIENRPKAQRQDSNWLTTAPNSGPLKAATPQIAEMTANSCGQMARRNSRSTETKASDTSAPPPSPSISRPARNTGIEGAAAQSSAPAA